MKDEQDLGRRHGGRVPGRESKRSEKKAPLECRKEWARSAPTCPWCGDRKCEKECNRVGNLLQPLE